MRLGTILGQAVVALLCAPSLVPASTPDNAAAIPDFKLDTIDVGVVSIVSPVGNAIDTGDVVSPSALVYNDGNVSAAFDVTFTIIRRTGTVVVYSQTQTVTGLAPDSAASVVFPVWPKPHSPGWYDVSCSTYIALDIDPADDVLTGQFRITAGIVAPYGWSTRSEMPPGMSGRQVKDGGWLAYDGGPVIFGAKGAKTDEFYCYEPNGDTWHALGPIPLGSEGKLPYKGAVGCANGRDIIYATKGNNTCGFWAYYVDGDSWKQLADVPLGLSNKKVKGGTDIVFHQQRGPGGVPYVYLLKGYRNEFYRYNCETDSWETRASAPYGFNGKWDKGSWIVHHRAGDAYSIYAHKSKYHEFYLYDVLGDSWRLSTPLRPMPILSLLTGKTKKAKDGSSACWYNGTIWAFKGANTQEFWQYFPVGDSWHEQDTIPSLGTSLRRKKVKAGGDLVDADLIYAFKGNKVNEFWRYYPWPVPDQHGQPGNEGATTSSASVGMNLWIDVKPNPLAERYANVRYELPVSGPAQIAAYDAAGRRVLRQDLAASRFGTVRLDMRGLTAGAYLLEFSAGPSLSVVKLVMN